MEWNEPNIKLPELEKDKDSRRCLGFCECSADDVTTWRGYVDVHFNPQIGWRRCDNRDYEHVKVLKWTYWENIENGE